MTGNSYSVFKPDVINRNILIENYYEHIHATGH